MTSALVNYGSYDLDAANEEHDDLSRAGGGQFMKLEVGRNVVRLLPPPVGRRSPFVTTYQHFLDIPGRDGPVVFNCPRMMERRPCPACAKGDRLRATGNQKDAEAARDFWASRRVFANVIDRSDEDAGPKVLGFGKTVHEALVAIRRDEDAGGDFTHPIDGFDIIIERVGTGKMDTRYKVFPARRSSSIGDKAEEWIAVQPDLRALARVPTLDEIKAQVRGDSGEVSTGVTAQSDVERLAGGIDDDDDIPM